MIIKMKLKGITKEELETMSYDDVAYQILKEKGKKMKLIDLFNAVCEVMELDKNVKEDYIADFFTLLSTEKRFVNLDKGFWDLRENHTMKVEIPDEDEETEEDNSEEVPEEETETEEDIYVDETSDDDTTDDEYKDLVIMDEEVESDL